MNPTRGTQRRWLLAFGGAAMTVAISGCSVLIARSGVSSASEIYQPQTRAEVREAFGEADETGTCPDGRPVERRVIGQQVPHVCADPRERCLSALPVVGELFATLAQADRSERAKLRYAFVYGADDRVLYRYDLTATPATRFWQAFPVLTSFWSGDSLAEELEQSGGASRESCFSAFAAEVRHRAARVDYPLTSQDEATLQLMKVLAAEVHAGRLAPDETLAEYEWCLSSAPFSCLRP